MRAIVCSVGLCELRCDCCVYMCSGVESWVGWRLWRKLWADARRGTGAEGRSPANERIRQAIGREMNNERVRFNVTQSMAPYAYSVPKKLKATERRVDAGSALGAMLAPLAGAGAAS